jgi:hypothetical protein
MKIKGGELKRSNSNFVLYLQSHKRDCRVSQGIYFSTVLDKKIPVYEMKYRALTFVTTYITPFQSSCHFCCVQSDLE